MRGARGILRAALAGALVAAAGATARPARAQAQETGRPAAAAERAARLDELITEGRARLAERRPEEAEAAFRRARELDPTSSRPRLWILRAWMDQGRSNDTLDAIDALAPEDVTDAERDYLYGMAFVRRAEGYIASGVRDESLQINFVDAAERLPRALAAQPERFADAWSALAKAAWYAQDLPLAREAAEEAVDVAGTDARAWYQLGHVALSQFVAAQSEEPQGAEAPAHRERACEAFARAIAYFGRPIDDPEEQGLLADAATQLGHARMWRRESSRAADAYAIAMAWAPTTVDYGTIYELLLRPATGEREDAVASGAYFLRAVEEAARRFDEAFGKDDPRDATLRWWLGWSRYRLGPGAATAASAERSAEAFEHALEHAPDFVSAWFWLARVRYDAGELVAASDALARGWRIDPAVLLAEVQKEADASVRMLRQLVDEAYARGDLERAALLAEVAAEARPLDAALWNNLGFFLCERADELRDASDEVPPDPAVLEALGERALVAYARALELSPDDPRLLNDFAVVLHHHLGRDLVRARELYERALVLSRAALASEGLDAAERTFHEEVVEDAEANLAELAPLLEEASEPAPAPQDGTSR